MVAILFILGFVTICSSIILTVGFVFFRRRFNPCFLATVDESIKAVTPIADVTVVMPARDEEHTIASGISSIILQQGVAEVIVVNDHSSDATEKVVLAFSEKDSRIKLVHAPDLPRGWLGKNHALQTGSTLCRTKYILFTDADVHFHEEVVSLVRNFMETHHLDHVGGMFGIECETIAEKICCPILSTIALAALAITAKKQGAGTGAFNMLRKDTYDRIGGHTRIANRIVDDVSLARIVKKYGYSTEFVDLSQLVTVRLFVGLRGYWEVVARSALPFLNNSLPLALGLAFITLTLVVTLAIAPIVGFVFLALFFFDGQSQNCFFALFQYLVFFSGAVPFLIANQCHNGRRLWPLLYPFVLLIMALSVIASGFRILLQKPIVWRGREYSNVERGSKVKSEIHFKKSREKP